MLDRLSGKILHIDFGDCFEVSTRCRSPGLLCREHTFQEPTKSTLSSDSLGKHEPKGPPLPTFPACKMDSQSLHEARACSWTLTPQQGLLCT